MRLPISVAKLSQRKTIIVIIIIIIIIGIESENSLRFSMHWPRERPSEQGPPNQKFASLVQRILHNNSHKVRQRPKTDFQLPNGPRLQYLYKESVLCAKHSSNIDVSDAEWEIQSERERER